MRRQFSDSLIERTEMRVHVAIDVAIEPLEDRLRGWLRLERASGSRHRGDRRLEVGMKSHTNRGIDGGTQPGRLVYVRARCGHAENIGGELHGDVTLRTATHDT